MYVVHYFNAGAWGGSGNVALFAVDVNDDANNNDEQCLRPASCVCVLRSASC